MNSLTWIAIYFPIFILLFVIVPQQNKLRRNIIKKKRKKGIKMTNELIVKYLNKKCLISSGSMGINIEGTIIAVKDNWIEVETKRDKQLINIEFIQNIKIRNKQL